MTFDGDKQRLLYRRQQVAELHNETLTEWFCRRYSKLGGHVAHKKSWRGGMTDVSVIRGLVEVFLGGDCDTSEATDVRLWPPPFDRWLQ